MDEKKKKKVNIIIMVRDSRRLNKLIKFTGFNERACTTNKTCKKTKTNQ